MADLTSGQVVATANWTPVIYNSNGTDIPMILPGTNIPYGYQAVDFNTWQQLAQRPPGIYQGNTKVGEVGQTNVTGSQVGGELQQLMQNSQLAPVIQQWQSGNMNTPSGQIQVKDANGQTDWTTQDSLTQAQQQQAGILNGTLVKLPNGTTVPAGSAAASNPLGVQTQQPQQRTLPTTPSPTNQPVQQTGAPQRATYAAGPAGDQQYQSALARFQANPTAVQQGQQQALASPTQRTLITSASQLPTTPTDPSTLKINTGDPQLDQTLNSYLDSLWSSYQSYAGTLPKTVDDTTINGIIADFEKNNPEWATERSKIESQYQTQVSQAATGQQISQDTLNTQTGQQTTDINTQLGYNQEDFKTASGIIGRNLTQAEGDTQASLAARGLAFGGTANKELSRVDQSAQDQLDALKTSTTRTAAGLNTQLSNLGTNTALSQRSLDLNNTETQTSLQQSLDAAQRNLTQQEYTAAGNAVNKTQTQPFALS